VGEVNGVAFLFQHAADDLGEPAFVFDYKDVHGWLVVSLLAVGCWFT